MAISVQGVKKAFGRNRALNDFILDVPWGQTLAILGPNGSGKTTLIKILAGLSKADEGTVRLGEIDILDRGNLARRGIGLVAHDPLIYDGLTVYENLLFFARMYGVRCIDKKIRNVSSMIGISNFLDYKSVVLSHGMKKRISIARALLHNPPILIMDEPESGLDQEALRLLDKILLEKISSERAVLLTTHDISRALALGDRIVIMAHGRVVYDHVTGSESLEEMRMIYEEHTRGSS